MNLALCALVVLCGAGLFARLLLLKAKVKVLEKQKEELQLTLIRIADQIRVVVEDVHLDGRVCQACGEELHPSGECFNIDCPNPLLDAPDYGRLI